MKILLCDHRAPVYMEGGWPAVKQATRLNVNASRQEAQQRTVIQQTAVRTASYRNNEDQVLPFTADHHDTYGDM